MLKYLNCNKTMLIMKNRKQKKALALLASGKTTFSSAASLAGMNVWDFADLVKEEKIVWIKEKKFIEEDVSAFF